MRHISKWADSNIVDDTRETEDSNAEWGRKENAGGAQIYESNALVA